MHVRNLKKTRLFVRSFRFGAFKLDPIYIVCKPQELPYQKYLKITQN